MHPRNPYRTPPDFNALAGTYPPLRPFIRQTANGGGTIDFKNDAAQRRLTEALLKRDFQIVLKLPEDRLCPPVPNRLNYVLWIQDIVAISCPEVAVRGVDIGTGASAIYPLLGCRSSPSWRFVGTDDLSIVSAQANVESNGLSHRIDIVRAQPGGPIFLPLLQDSDVPFDFTMCNPPFYSSSEEVTASAEAKEYTPNAVCTGADVEMITAGGEAQFVATMVRESLQIKDSCRWYTSMLGKMASLSDVVTLFREHSIDNYAITEFVQGQTRRWAVAWSFQDARLPDGLARISNTALHTLMPARNTLRQRLSHTPPVSALPTVLSALRDVIVSPNEASSFIATVRGDTWSRAARRKGTPVALNTELIAPSVCRVSVIQDEAGPAVEFTRVRGRDRQVFESFVNHVGRKMREFTA
ncbi:S-adenosyl-L-methionine dependent methyltransferase [Auriscalpium vulgare]|uniref:S-adenosyl-L-methionine dependent methyltransferase n=1 Tax=Auriscalpium vulgare TaxID=40419 RepID=A0ACB8S266_9AGAM|nr:S-adenosyl-L-methionine dependent methyltransferase [Auriscalpium vulgare]